MLLSFSALVRLFHQSKKAIKITEVEPTFGVINESLYANHMHLMLLWWETNKFYNTYYISNDEIHIIRSVFLWSGSYN